MTLELRPRSAYNAGNFELTIDDETNKSTAFLKSIDGGFVNTSAVDEPVGGGLHHVKHAAVAAIDPVSAECGMAGSTGIINWIKASWDRDFARRNGHILHADFNMKQTYEHHFYDALITETTFPTLDGSSKDAAYLKFKFQAERVHHKSGGGESINDKNVPEKQKLWLCSCFRFTIDNVDGLEHVNKIDSFTVKQGIKQFYTGQDRFPQLEPTKIEFPNITGTIAQGYGAGLQKWYDESVAKGMRDEQSKRNGALEFLGPDRQKVLFRIRLEDCGLLKYNIEPSTANADQIKRAKFEIFVSHMMIDGTDGLA